MRVEGGYYRATPAERALLDAPLLDEKILTGWNGLAIGALAQAAFILDRPDWMAAARDAADLLITRHRRADGKLVRASLGDRISEASATLEDYGGLAGGLLDLALAAGEPRYASAARDLVDLCIDAAEEEKCALEVPGGGDPVLQGNGMGIRVDPSEGAYPSGAVGHRIRRPPALPADCGTPLRAGGPRCDAPRLGAGRAVAERLRLGPGAHVAVGGRA